MLACSLEPSSSKLHVSLVSIYVCIRCVLCGAVVCRSFQKGGRCVLALARGLSSKTLPMDCLPYPARPRPISSALQGFHLKVLFALAYSSGMGVSVQFGACILGTIEALFG